MASAMRPDTEGGSRPVPDPTELTSAAVAALKAELKELFGTQFGSIGRNMERLEKLFDAIPEGVDYKLNKLQELLDNKSSKQQELQAEKFETVKERFHTVDEKFESIAIQFRERDTRTEQATTTGKVAIDAALQAQKEAVGKQNESSDRAIAKSEAATTKLLDQLGILIAATDKATSDKFSDIKERMTALESSRSGSREQVQETRAAQSSERSSNSFVMSIIVGAFATLFGLGGFVFGIISLISSHAK